VTRQENFGAGLSSIIMRQKAVIFGLTFRQV